MNVPCVRRRSFAVSAAWAAGAALALKPSRLLLAAELGSWRPTRPVTVYVPGAGGATDVHVRWLSERVSRMLGQPFIIEQRPGAATTLAGAAVAQTRPDGHSIAVLLPNTFRMPHMQRVAWDPMRDFDYVTGLASYTFGLLANKDTPWKSVDELAAVGRSAPGKLTCGTAGNGTTGHLLMLELERLAGAKFLHVPYKGSAETGRALLAKEVDFILEAGSVVSQGQQGIYRLLAIADEEPSPLLPGTPTLRQRGWDTVSTSTYGIVCRKGTPEAAIQALSAAYQAAMASPEHDAMLEQLVIRKWALGPREYQTWAENYFRDVRPVLVRAGLVTT